MFSRELNVLFDKDGVFVRMVKNNDIEDWLKTKATLLDTDGRVNIMRGFMFSNCTGWTMHSYRFTGTLVGYTTTAEN